MLNKFVNSVNYQLIRNDFDNLNTDKRRLLLEIADKMTKERESQSRVKLYNVLEHCSKRGLDHLFLTRWGKQISKKDIEELIDNIN